MEHERHVTLRLSERLLISLGRAARLRGIAVPDLMRAILSDGAGQTLGILPDLPIRAPIAAEVAAATDWVDLQSRLRRNGVVLRCAGDAELALHDWPGDRYLLPLSRLGLDEASLTLRFRSPFPGRCAPQHSDRGRQVA